MSGPGAKNRRRRRKRQASIRGFENSKEQAAARTNARLVELQLKERLGTLTAGEVGSLAVLRRTRGKRG